MNIFLVNLIFFDRFLVALSILFLSIVDRIAYNAVTHSILDLILKNSAQDEVYFIERMKTREKT